MAVPLDVSSSPHDTQADPEAGVTWVPVEADAARWAALVEALLTAVPPEYGPEEAA